MRSEPSQRIPKTACNVWRISGAIWSLILWLIPAAFWYFDQQGVIELSTYMVIIAVLLMLTILFVIVIPYYRWKRWRYEVNEHEIDLQHGLFIVRRTLVPVNRVQHVDTRQGPILRNYKLSNVAISTAATTHQIPALTDEHADAVRDRISRLALKAKEDV